MAAKLMDKYEVRYGHGVAGTIGEQKQHK